ncbi:hypothetical protein BIT31_26770 [Klebsiella pneumoniae]|nr:hypothetical protein BIT31_26770 [Klebsiella pneumoniae]
MVCGQCHVEYYFDGKNKAVKFPWDDGMKVENMEQYYDKIAFSDWTNSLSKTPMLKAQHPEYETWTAGIHGKNNVTWTFRPAIDGLRSVPCGVLLRRQKQSG